ncbi:MAG TPA: ORF6N domain-containing protein [Opitutaceae bacterium]|nr:ORF6N domain-containing protein [Opitutaceae bacterium]
MPQSANKSAPLLIPPVTDTHIHLLRERRVLLDGDLARLYRVPTGALNRAVKRNLSRFPADFMFQLTAAELENLKCQIGISSFGHGGRRRSRPYAFTQEGVAMLSSVLRSPRAVAVNIEIMRAFVRLRRLTLSVKELAGKVEALEKKYDGQFGVIFEAIRELMTSSHSSSREEGTIGFHGTPKRKLS